MNIEFDAKKQKIRFIDTKGISEKVWQHLADNMTYLGYTQDVNQVKYYFNEHTWLAEDQSISAMKVLYRNDCICGKEMNPEMFDWLENSFAVKRTSNTDHILEKAKNRFGTTSNMGITGYILNDGSALRLSYDGFTRNMDHREIIDVMEDEYDSNTKAMIEFMNYGNIRVMSNGIDITRPPNRLQIEKLRSHINYIIRKFNEPSYFVDISNKDGTVVKAFAYNYPDINRIIRDITDYFEKIVM